MQKKKTTPWLPTSSRTNTAQKEINAPIEKEDERQDQKKRPQPSLAVSAA
jgi:hypothetical protein